MREGTAVHVRDLGKMYRIYSQPQDRLKQMVLGRMGRRYGEEFWALRHVSFELDRGETFGIIGRNGSGKSTLLQIIAGILSPTEGEVLVSGRVAALLELGSGFNPDFTGRENAVTNGVILGIPTREMESRLDEIAAFADIGEFFDQPVKLYSSGMFVRLAFAVATSLDPDILVVDEALAVGDIFFQQKCYRRLESLRDRGVSILLVSHSMSDLEQFCRRGLLLDRGEVVYLGSSAEAVRHYYLLDQAAHAPASSPVDLEASSWAQTERDWPPAEALLDISQVPQVSNGWARCTGVALCDAQGRPRTTFEQGEAASFFYEFEMLRAIEVPIGGFQIFNSKAVLAHGRNTLQHDSRVPSLVRTGHRVRFRHDVELQIGTGEYSFEVGLATIARQHFEARARYSEPDLHAQIVRVCHLAAAGRFTVVLPKGALQSRHYGVADLPGRCEVATVSPAPEAAP